MQDSKEIKKTETNEVNKGDAGDRRKRIELLKRLIVASAVVLLLIPSVLSTVALVRIRSIEQSVSDTQDMIADMYDKLEAAGLSGSELEARYSTGTSENSEISVSSDVYLSEGEEYGTLIYDGSEGANKTVYLTFDDGPSAGTDEILDILKKYDVKATFFVNGHEGYEEVLKRMAREGHTIGMHSYSHEYSDIYADLDHFAEDLDEVHSYVLDATGVDSIFYRFPGGTSTCRRFTDVKDCTEYLDAKGIRHYDWNVSADDSVGRKKSASEISAKVIGDIERSDKNTIIVLLHDAPGKKTTIEALPAIIEAVRSMDGTELAPITESTEPVYFK